MKAKQKLLPGIYQDSRNSNFLWLINGQYSESSIEPSAPYAVCFGGNSISPFNFLVYQTPEDFWSINNDYKFTRVI